MRRRLSPFAYVLMANTMFWVVAVMMVMMALR